MRLTPELICLDRPPADKMAAIARAAELLTDAGCVEEPFRYGMIAREAMSNTYLGHGVALPHGVAQTERHIRENGMAVIRAPEGIPWGPNAEKAELIIAVAAQHEEYLAALRHIASLLDQDDRLARLKNATQAQDIIDLLTLPCEKRDTTGSSDTPHCQGIVYPHAPGLHLLPATRLSDLVRTLDGDVRVHAADGRSANAGNASELIALGIVHGDAISISASHKAALEAVIEHICQESQTPEEAETLRNDPPHTTAYSSWRIAGYAAAAMALLALLYWLLQ
ncbi:MAG: PTS sugar transporter subunit IIA [Cardiobacteriaceae bacterium]|nr:PTS sugar transporter subunit IIA [Cardiobacteriaceae bacterium]